MTSACPVTVRGQHYPSIKAAAAAHGRTQRQALRHLDRYGHLDYLGLPVGWTRPDARKRVKLVGGLEFESLTAAAEALGVDRKTIRNAATSASAREYLLVAIMRYKEKKT